MTYRILKRLVSEARYLAAGLLGFSAFVGA